MDKNEALQIPPRPGQPEQQAGPSAWYLLSRGDIDQLVRSLSVAYEVVGARMKDGRYTLDRISDPAELKLEFPPRVHSPKKFLFPNWEKLFRFRLGGKVMLEAEKAAVPRVIFGMHPCDLHAVQVLDDCLFEGEADSTYQAKRQATVLIGVDCEPDEFCFCTSLGTDKIDSGFDLFLHRSNDGYLARVGSARGLRLLRRYLPEIREVDNPQLPPAGKSCQRSLRFPMESLAPVLGEVYDHAIWQEIGERCLGCGSCNLLCPTCYCFNVQDRLDINLQGGERVRTWDSCQFDQFTKVSGGSDFRPDQTDRQRHRFFRKYKYLWEKHQRTACVGCGRCARECLAGIDNTEVLNSLFAEQVAAVQSPSPGLEYQPQMAELLSVDSLTGREKLFRLRLPEPVSFRPGAFMQVSVFGVGEAPLTIASAPDADGHEIELVVRSKGSLTKALHRLKAGDAIGVRGPFGNGFPVEEFVGRDVLLVAGGIGLVTLRSLLLTILARREEFGRVMLLYGSHSIDQALFRDDLKRWHLGDQLDCRFAVQHFGSQWGVTGGDITHLFRDLDIVPARAVAAVSGPAVMYRNVNPLLFGLGFTTETIYLNLERHMKCGLGKCGRCQINDITVCQCGPIFPYSQVQHLREAIER
ncbi:4Fe-4S dicluster domain-containing protein [Geothermobacter hydrogeniphilus]|uniref:NAD(P)H-flavin reductase n=1 Tax=Geothermobacter hydrogeniphilus TaxID=1969733 RepID=A0A1X0Y0T2_9BACT|nr:4Fe-4S dicluster domain-containing protein [Geothermobacter hydrogeniphilus]ORJ58719.1 hypothetical protein B5V00_11495 [Geothermobacter hydrogeniphilus]